MDTTNGYGSHARNQPRIHHRIHVWCGRSRREEASDALVDFAAWPAEAQTARFDQAVRIDATGARSIKKTEADRGRGDTATQEPRPTGEIGKIEEGVSCAEPDLLS